MILPRFFVFFLFPPSYLHLSSRRLDFIAGNPNRQRDKLALLANENDHPRVVVRNLSLYVTDKPDVISGIRDFAAMFDFADDRNCRHPPR